MKNMNYKMNHYANKLVEAFLKKKIITPIPKRFTKNLKNANYFRRLCESKIKIPIIGFKAGGTSIPLLKKLKEKEPFYAAIYKSNLLKNNQRVKINNYTLGIELEVCFLIKKNFFDFKKQPTNKNIIKFIMYTAPCIEVVGYRQRKKGIKTLGDLCSDFGGNIKFILGPKKKFKRIKYNLKTYISNKKLKYLVHGNTNTVYVNPINSLRFVLKKLKKDKVRLNTNFYIFTGSTVGVVPLKGKGLYTGKVDRIGSVKTKIV